jgi:hypothetical protein
MGGTKEGEFEGLTPELDAAHPYLEMEMLDILGNESSYKTSNQSTEQVTFLRGAQSQFTAFLHTYAPPSEVGELEKGVLEYRVILYPPR